MNSAIVQYYVIPYFSPVFTVAFLTYFTSFGLPASMLYLNSTEFKLHYIWQFSLISINILLFFFFHSCFTFYLLHRLYHAYLVVMMDFMTFRF